MVNPVRSLLRTVTVPLRRRHSRRTLREVSLLLGAQTITLADVGAAGGLEPRWKTIQSKVRVIGFEPDARSNARLSEEAAKCASYRMEPYALWERAGPLRINLCRKPNVSSHYVPNIEFLSHFPEVENFEVVGEIDVEARTLDAVNLGPVDFIKLDIQGGELNVLKGAEVVLSRVFGIECEVEFVALYKEQPLFGDVCQFLGPRGFEFIDFIHFGSGERGPGLLVGMGREPGLANSGQCVCADALFLRTPESVMASLRASIITIADLRRYAAILVLYGRYDLLKQCLLVSNDFVNDRALFAEIGRVVAGATKRAKIVRRIYGRFNYVCALCDNNTRAHILY